ncbi:hypothetical protein D3C75_915520 [compost metagenome]
MTGGIVANPQLAVGVQIVIQHHLYPQRAVGQSGGAQHRAGTAPVFTQLQFHVFSGLRHSPSLAFQPVQCPFVGPAELGARHHFLTGVAALAEADAIQRLQVGGLWDQLPAVGGVNHRVAGFDIQRQPLLAVVQFSLLVQLVDQLFGNGGGGDQQKTFCRE